MTMNFLSQVQRWIRSLFFKGRFDAEMDAEIRSHIELRIQANIAAGMGPEAARWAAQRQFGWVESIKEDCRDQRRGRWLAQIAQDVRYGARQLRRNPGFTVVAMLTLALGIGANTAIFSVINTALLRSLPFRAPNELVRLFEFDQQRGYGGSVSPRLYLDLREQARSFVGLAAFRMNSFHLAGGEFPELVQGFQATPNVFSLLGIRPAFGRVFTEDEGQPGRDKVVILSYRFWQRRFGGDPSLVGTSITLDDTPMTVIGILPSSFSFLTPEQCEIWQPYSPQGAEATDNPDLGTRSWRNLLLVGRLKSGTALASARAEAATISQHLQREQPKWYTGWALQVEPLRSLFVGRELEQSLLVLLGAVGFVLVIACANVANLLLARAANRRRELSVRLALGAGEGRVIRQLLTESLLLAGLSAGAGLLVAHWGINALRPLIPVGLPQTSHIGLDWTVLGFTIGLATLAGIGFGLVPAWRCSRPNLTDSLKEGGVGMTAGVERGYFRSILVSAEVAFTMVLLVGAGLMIRTIVTLLHVDPGFDPHHLMSMRIDFAASQIPAATQMRRLEQDFMQRLRSLPGVISVAAEVGGFGSEFIVEGQANPAALLVERVSTGTNDYLQAMKIPLLEGRRFTAEDGQGDGGVVIANASMVRHLWPHESAIGKRVRWRGMDMNGKLAETPWLTVVGVAKDVKTWSYDQQPQPAFYQPLESPGGATISLEVQLIIRTAGEPLTLDRTIRRELKNLNPNLPVSQFRNFETSLAASNSGRRLYTALLTIFAAFGVLLSCVGLYGVVAYSVAQRTHEIGVRMALGGERNHIIWLVLRQGLSWSVLGLLVGGAAAAVLARLIASQLYGVKATDPLTLVTVAVILIIASLLACLIPARRAASVDPMVALRYE